MATTLYTNNEKGDLVTVVVETKRVQPHLDNGYVCDPAELVAPTKEEADTNDTGKLSVEEIRAAAKKAGVRNWHNKKIETLKRDLGYVD